MIYPRLPDYDPLRITNINSIDCSDLITSSFECWDAIKKKDVKALGAAFKKCYRSQIRMFPAMAQNGIKYAIEEFNAITCGCKVTGAGGGSYLVIASEKPIGNGIQITPCGW
jgi:mevalonate kinase